MNHFYSGLAVCLSCSLACTAGNAQLAADFAAAKQGEDALVSEEENLAK